MVHPGENITGVTSYSHELSGKRLGLLKEIVPKALHFGILHNRNTRALSEMNRVAQALRIKIEPFEVFDAQNLENVFAAMNQQQVEAFLVQGQSVLASHREEILRFAARSQLPAIYAWARWVTTGGLSSYAAMESERFRRAATYVGKILKGVKPGDLPIDQPMKFEFIINLKAAKQIGLTIPQAVLYRADKVIK